MASLKQQLLSGAFYTALSKYSGVLITLIVSGILGRLLSPPDFGIVAISTIIITFFSMFSNMGISAAVIQNKELTRDDLSSIFSITVWFGIFLAGLFFASSPLIASFYGQRELLGICQILSVQLLFATANIIPNSLFYRDKRFKFLAGRTITIQVLSGALAIVAALSGWGYYALLVNPIISSILLFIISFITYPQQLRLRPNTTAIRKIFSYSAYQFLFNFVNYFSNNFDKLFLGKNNGMTTLGYYEKSYRLMEMPLQNLTHVIGPVMHPVLSDYQHDKKQLDEAHRKIVRFLAFLGLPMSVVLFFTARELMLIIFGEQWGPSVPVLQIMSIAVGIRVVLNSSGAIFQAANDTRSLFICGIFSAVVNITGILAGYYLFGTIEAIAGMLCISYFINFIQCYWQMYRITLKQPAYPFLHQFLSPLGCSATLIAVLWPLSFALDGFNLALSLILKCAVALAVFGSYLHLSGACNIVKTIKQRRFITS